MVHAVEELLQVEVYHPALPARNDVSRRQSRLRSTHPNLVDYEYKLAFRHFSHLTLSILPSLGAIHEVAVPHPADAVATAVAAQLAPAGKKTDWTGFYGYGGGFDMAAALAAKVPSVCNFVQLL